MITDIQAVMVNAAGPATVENESIFIIKYLVTFTLKLNGNFDQINWD